MLVSEQAVHILGGSLYEALVPLLDGTREPDELAESLGPEEDPAHVFYAILKLEQNGHLVEAGAPLPLPRGVDSGRLLGEARAAAAMLPEGIRIETVGGVPEETVMDHLAHLGISRGRRDGPVLVLAEDYLHPDLEAWNREARSSQTPWLLCRPVGTTLWVGPWVTPDVGPCWRCLAERVQRNRAIQTYLADRTGSLAPLFFDAPWSRESLAAALNKAVIRLAGAPPGPDHRWVERTDLVLGQVNAHRVPRRPQCPTCGDPGITALSMRSPLELRPQAKRFLRDGGHRAVHPEVTVERLSAHIDPITGVVPYLHKMSLDHLAEDPESGAAPLHLFVAGGNEAHRGEPLHLFRQSLRKWSGGKGMSETQAKASALGEAVERYCGVFQGDEARIRTTLARLGSDGLHPNESMLFSDRQYAERGTSGQLGQPDMVPRPFDPDEEMDWTPLWSLTRQAHRYLPTALLFYRYPSSGNPPSVIADSNGAAAGNTLEEAVLQGFLELVERDATAIWWYNRIRRRSVDLESLDVPYWRDLSARYHRMDRDLWVLDLTSDLGIPTYAAVTSRRGEGSQEILLGLGCHLDPSVAISRSLTEMNQMLAAKPHDAQAQDSQGLGSWLRNARLEDHPYLLPSDESPLDLTSPPRLFSEDLRDDVETCRRIVEGAGLEMLVLNQTRADVGMPVVKVMIPGLRFFRPRFFSGRLYDVPITMGWLNQPCDESRMNPVPFFL